MADFAYEARDDEGKLVTGRITADSIDHAGRLLSERNLFVVRIAPERTKQRKQTSRSAGASSRAETAWLMSQLSVMVETGILLSEGLDCLLRQTSKPRLRLLLEDVTTSVKEGRSLSSVMENYPRSFPPSVTALIRAGESNGTMSRVLARSAAYQLADLETVKKIKVAMMYPVFMMVLCLVVTVILVTLILPRFAKIFAIRHAKLPLPTRILMGINQNITTHWMLWLSGALVVCGLSYLWIRSEIGRRVFDRTVVNVPGLANLFNSLYQSRTFRTMATMLETGVSLVDAIKIVQDIVPNQSYRELWQQVCEKTQRGEPMAGPLIESPLIDEPVALMIECGDRAGRLGLVFSRLADFKEREYEQLLKAATQFIEPAMILVMGGIIGFIAASIMLPLFQASRVVAG